MLHFETPIIYLELRGSGEAKEAIRKRVKQVHNYLRHRANGCMLLLLHRWKGGASASILAMKGSNSLWSTINGQQCARRDSSQQWMILSRGSFGISRTTINYMIIAGREATRTDSPNPIGFVDNVLSASHAASTLCISALITPDKVGANTILHRWIFCRYKPLVGNQLIISSPLLLVEPNPWFHAQRRT